MGATNIRIDTEEGHAGYALAAPTQLDFAAIEKATHGAGYTLQRIEVEVPGRFVQLACEVCDEVRTFLEIEGTGQTLEVSGEAPDPGIGVQVRGSVTGWATGHATVEVLQVTRAP